MINVLMMTPQNFAIPAGYNEIITFDVDPAITPSLVDTVIWWRVYNEMFGIPDGPPILEKTMGDIVPYDSPLSFTVQMYTADTLNLLRNYYHEATIINAAGEDIGGSWGIMTVLATYNRESGQ